VAHIYFYFQYDYLFNNAPLPKNMIAESYDEFGLPIAEEAKIGDDNSDEAGSQKDGSKKKSAVKKK
jgi:hypothetical protein